jgi:hypothetical protein
LCKGGRFVLREYHQVIWKLLKQVEGQFIANGNYFEQDVTGEIQRWIFKDLSEGVEDRIPGYML